MQERLDQEWLPGQAQTSSGYGDRQNGGQERGLGRKLKVLM